MEDWKQEPATEAQIKYIRILRWKTGVHATSIPSSKLQAKKWIEKLQSKLPE